MKWKKIFWIIWRRARMTLLSIHIKIVDKEWENSKDNIVVDLYIFINIFDQSRFWVSIHHGNEVVTT